MGILATVTASTVAVGAASAAVLAPATADVGGVDMWTLIEKGGAPMACVLFLALVEVVRRHDKAYKTIEAKDAIILEMSTRQTKAIETTNEIAVDQMSVARSTERLLADLVALARGKIG